MPEEKNHQRFYSVLPFLLYGLLISLSLNYSWMKWGDLIIDSGKEWYVPAQILSGKMLYRDLFWPYGPLTPYLNALFFALFGMQIGSLVLSGILSLLLTVYALHQLAKRVLGTLESVLVVSTFILVCAFGFYVLPRNYNFMIPYTYAVTYGLAFALLSVYFYLKTKDKAGKHSETFTIVFLCAALLTRLEIGLMTLAAIVLPVILDYVADRSRGRSQLRLCIRITLLSIGASALLFILFFGSLLNGETWNTVWVHITTRGTFEENLSGINNIGQNLQVWLISICLYAGFTLFFAGAGAILTVNQDPSRPGKDRVSILLVALITLGLAGYLANAYFGYLAQYRCLPLLCLIVGIQSARKLYKGQDPNRQSVLLTLSLLSFFMLLRIFFRVWPGHFGFTLLVPGLIVYYHFFLKTVPAMFTKDRVRLFVRGGFVFLSLFFIYKFADDSMTGYSRCTLEVSSDRGNLLFFPYEPNVSSNLFLDYLNKNTKPDESLTVFPEGVGFNFLSGRTNALTEYNFNPVDLAPAGTTQRVMDQLDKNLVPYVAVLQRDTSSQGFSAFGKDYGNDLMAYILKNYELKQLFGSYPYSSDRFGIALFKRKTTLAPNSGK